MRRRQSLLAVAFLAAAAFVLIRLALDASDLDRLFDEQIPVHAHGRTLVILAVIAPYTVALLASLLSSAIARGSTAVAYGASWLVYSSLLSQALLSMSGAYLLILPLMIPANAMTGWLHPDRWYLPLHYTSAHKPVVVGLISVGLALVVVGIVDLLKASRHNRLAMGGLYAIIRHPQHLAIILWTLGFALWGASPVDMLLWFFASAVFVGLGMHEEGKLVQRYASEYVHYRQQVMFMPPFLPIRGPIPATTAREAGVIAVVLVLGVAAILALFYAIGVPA